jgi:N-acetylmuramoyl-L-alanine amidase
MKKRHCFLIFIFALASFLFLLGLRQTGNIKNFLAGVFFTDSTTERQLKNDYNAAKNNGEKIKILVVAGHDNDYWGTEFKGLKEANLNLLLAKNIVDFFKQEKEFEMILARDENGYRPELLSYFSRNKQEIEKFIRENMQTTNAYIESGVVQKYTGGVRHNSAPEEVALRLYGINKWANEY